MLKAYIASTSQFGGFSVTRVDSRPFCLQGAQSTSIASDVYSGPYVLHALCRVHYRRNFSIRPQIHEAKHACPLCNINSNNYSVVGLSTFLTFSPRIQIHLMRSSSRSCCSTKREVGNLQLRNWSKSISANCRIWPSSPK